MDIDDNMEREIMNLKGYIRDWVNVIFSSNMIEYAKNDGMINVRNNINKE